MKKLAVSIIVTLALSMAAAIAQTGTDPSQGTSGAKPSEQQPAPATSPASQATSTDTASTDKADKKLRGCVQSQGGQYVLESKKGKAIALTGQDVSAHVGHEVSLKGTWESGSAGTGVSTASGPTSEKTFNVAGVTMISDSCGGKASKGDSGSMGASPSTPNSEGTGSTSNPPQQ